MGSKVGVSEVGPSIGAVDWNRLAASYRRQVWLERSSIGSLLDMIEPGPGDRLLDVGTGTGELLRALAERPLRPDRADGIDASQAMLRQVPPLPGGWTLQEGPGEALPFEDATFDLVTASWVLHILEPETRQKVISEVRRVLKPGGRFAAITIAPPQSWIARLLTGPARAAADRWPSAFIGLSPFDPEPELLQAGFTAINRKRDFRGYPSLCLTARRS